MTLLCTDRAPSWCRQVYPLEPELLQRIDDCRAEYRVLDTHEVRGAIRVGAEIGTKYHVALIAPGENWGSDPDNEPEALEVQHNYAGQYLRSNAMLIVIELLVGREQFTRLEPKLLRSGSLDPAVLTQRVIDQLLWNYAAEQWREYALWAFDVE
jgi:hypothetical protein